MTSTWQVSVFGFMRDINWFLNTIIRQTFNTKGQSVIWFHCHWIFMPYCSFVHESYPPRCLSHPVSGNTIASFCNALPWICPSLILSFANVFSPLLLIPWFPFIVGNLLVVKNGIGGTKFWLENESPGGKSPLNGPVLLLPEGTGSNSNSSVASFLVFSHLFLVQLAWNGNIMNHNAVIQKATCSS